MKAKYLVVAALALASAGPAGAQSVRNGVEAWQRSDYSGAVAIWRPLAEKGDADAAFNLGQAYRLGRGVPPNLSAAKTWFERAATKGHIDAQATLGLLLFQNNEQAEGIKWLKAAAEQGDARAMLVYGTALVNGDGVTQDPVLGYAMISRASAQGLAPAKQTLADLNKLLPLETRRKGVALALQKAKATPAGVKSRKEARQIQPTKAPPAPKSPAKSNMPVAAANGAWRIQLGAFSQHSAAETLYRKLSVNNALSGRHAFYIPVGSMTRLQAGPFESKEAAAAACRALRAACFPVSAK